MGEMTVRQGRANSVPFSVPWWPGGYTHLILSLILLLHIMVADSTAKQSSKFTSISYNASVPENALDNTPVVSDEMMGIFIGDRNVTVKYKITEGDPNKLFKVNSRTIGNFCFLEISVRTLVSHNLNRERRSVHSLVVRGQYRLEDKRKVNIPGALTTVYITITDLNDLHPTFSQSEYFIQISEDTPLYSSVFEVSAEDPDDGLNGDIYYSFQHFNPSFCIHPSLGIITLTQILNFHEQSVFELVVMAQDRGYQATTEWTASTKINIRIMEVNVYEPQIKVSLYEKLSIRGHLHILGIVSVDDNDEGSSGSVESLEIVEGDPQRIFRIIKSSESNEFSIAALNIINWSESPHGYNITLKATDRGTRPRFSYKEVYIAPRMQLNDSTLFTKRTYQFSVSEAAPPGSFIASLAPWIPGDNSREIYYISEDTNVHMFSLEPMSGTLTTIRSLDAETINSYTFKVIGYHSNKLINEIETVTIKINVLDANDNTPMIVAPQGVVQMDEDKPPNTWVVKVRAQDYDFGKNGDVSYSLANSDSVPFTIDHFTGEVRTTEILDYESGRRVWKLLIRASDWGEPFRRQTEKVITIHVQDVNDNKPQFERVDCSGYIDRSAQIGTEIFTLSAVDFDAGNIISYRILKGNEDRCFNLDSSRGTLSLVCDLLDMDVSERLLNITATDGLHFADPMHIRLQLVQPGNTNSHSPLSGLNCRDMYVTKRLTEILADSKENNRKSDDSTKALRKNTFASNVHSPKFRNPLNELRIKENLEIGSVIYKFKSYDDDSGYDGFNVYAITGGNFESVFRMDVNTGELKVAGILDRERVDKYTLNLTAYDLGVPQKLSSHVLSVTIFDENDNSPKFDKVAYSFFLPESVANGTNVYQIKAVDSDLGRFGSIEYSLATETKDFSLNSQTGQLSVSQQLDYEKNAMYELRVVATDGGGLTAQTYVMVQVADVNDCTPKFPTNIGLPLKVFEDLPVGSFVSLINAYDEDSNRITYSLDNDEDGTFSIDDNSGVVYLRKSLNYEVKQMYNLTVRAADNGMPSLSTNTFIFIEVLDVNENVHSPVFGKDVAEASILENVPPQTLVLSLPAVDGDDGHQDSSVYYSLVGDAGNGLFYIDQQGDVYTSARLDRELQSQYWLTVKASDYGTVPRHSTIHVFIEVVDVNDNLPRPLEPVYRASVKENSLPGTHVVTLSAIDGDRDSVLRFNIVSGNPQSLFTIDSITGTIQTTGRNLDREHQSEHTLGVVIRDSSSEELSLSSQVMVNIRVLDENDHSPIFVQESYAFTVPFISSRDFWQSRPANDMEFNVGQVIAGDRDEGGNGDVTYRLDEESVWQDTFRVHPVTGIVTMRAPESSGKKYSLVIRAEDRGTPSRWNTVQVSVQVVGVTRSPLPPRLPSPSVVQISVTEDAPVGHNVHSVVVRDTDSNKLWFSIIDGSRGGAFGLDTTGNILVASHLDASKENKYNISVEISDGFNNVVARFMLSVLSTNAHHPSFSQSLYEIEIPEDSKPGSSVLSLTAEDKDPDSVLSYKFVTSYHTNHVSNFFVQPLTGEVSLGLPLDSEVRKEHYLLVSVTDNFSPAKSDFCYVRIKITDCNDHTPTFVKNEFNVTVVESSAVGSIVLQLLAFDKDSGANGYVTYTIVSGNQGSLFTIDRDSGLLSLQRRLDRKQISEAVLTVRATDGGSPSKHSHATVFVSVILPSNAAPRFAQSNIIIEVSEVASVGDYLGYLPVESPQGVSFSISVAPQIPSSSQRYKKSIRRPPILINPSSGVMILDAPLDYELEQSYNITVTASSFSGESSQATVILAVRDENDHAPSFLRNNYWGKISEASPVGTVVIETLPPNHTTSGTEYSAMKPDRTRPLVVTAEDKDSDHNANLLFVIVEPFARDLFTIDPATGAIRTARLLDHETLPLVHFSVSVRDGGEPSLAAATVASVTINVTDVNDVPPKFSRQEYNATLWTPTHKGVMVAHLTATDKDFNDSSPLEYSLVDGNEFNSFSIDSEKGIVTVENMENLKRFYKLKITANDGQLSTSTSLNIRVEKLPKSGLRFTHETYFGKVEEELVKVSRVALVQAIGSDLNEHLTYRLRTPTPYFNIGETSGVLQTTGLPFDRETQSNYLLLVEVNSARAVARSRAAQVQVRVIVSDKNDHAPEFYGTPYYGMVKKNAKLGSVIYKVEARDSDEGDNAKVRYEIIEEILGSKFSGKSQSENRIAQRRSNADYTWHSRASSNSRSIFSMDPDSGQIRLIGPLHPQEERYHLTVNAFDAGSPILSTQTHVTLRVVDQYEPVFEEQHYTAEVQESAARGQAVLTIEARVALSHRLIYTLSPQGPFDVDDDKGTIRVTDDLDYEQTQNYSVTVRATDAITNHWVEVFVQIHIIDVNDNPPKFHHQYFNPKISEAATPGTAVLKMFTKDKDSGKNAGVSYKINLLDGNSPRDFFIHSGTGLITLRNVLDREKEETHTFFVTATDTGSPPLSTTALVVVKVTDMNDNPPFFRQALYESQVSESGDRNEFVTLVAATDNDEAAGASLKYSIVGGNDLQTFKIETDTGIIRVWNKEQIRSRSIHYLNITVSDGVFSARTSLHITVMPVNAHAPTFQHAEYRFTIQENLPAGSFVGKLAAKDPDMGSYGMLTYRLLAEDANRLFSLDKKTGLLKCRDSLDRERVASHHLTVVAEDGGHKVGFAAITVLVADDNDNNPVFESNEYAAMVYQNASAGTTILKVQATDTDAGENGTVLYRLHESTSDLIRSSISVSPLTGELRLLRDIHFVGPSKLELHIEAVDQGPRTSGSHRGNTRVPVTVTVVGVRQNVPIFRTEGFTFSVREDAQPGEKIGTVGAVWYPEVRDPSIISVSAPATDDLDYSITWALEEDVSPPLAISPQGVLFLASLLDAEQTKELIFTVTATSKTKRELSASTRVRLLVEDVNDVTPRFQTNEYRISLAENTDTGSNIIRVFGEDGDSGSNSDLRYLLLEANHPLKEEPQFTMDPYTGWITLNTHLDADEIREHILKVEVRDSGRPSLSSTAIVIINVKDYNDNPPIWSEENDSQIEVPEDIAPDSVVSSLMISDADSDHKYHQFFIVSGNQRQEFRITEDGSLKVEKKLDREKFDSYSLKIAVTDGVFTRYFQLEITVSDVNDNRPQCTTSHYQHSVSESAAPGTLLLRVSSRDPDLTSAPRYDITGAGSNRFSIEQTTGKLSVQKRLDREKQPSYNLRVRVRDGGMPHWECFSSVQIDLTDVNDNSPTFSRTSYSVSVPENSPGVRLLTRVHAHDPDSGINQRISYFLVDSSSIISSSFSRTRDGLFELDSMTGILKVTRTLDREKKSHYNLTVEARDHGTPSLTSRVTIIVSVADMNDNPPEFPQLWYEVVVSEGVAVGENILHMPATSRDTGNNAKLTYEIVSGNDDGKLAIGKQSGYVSVQETLDYEKTRQFMLTVRATDSGQTPLWTEVSLNVTLSDINDNAPVFVQDSYSALIAEDADIGEKLIQVSATDQDSGDNGKMMFELLKGDPKKRFAIDKLSGWISVNRILDREDEAEYSLTVAAKDLGTLSRTGTVIVSVDIKDANDNPPVIHYPNRTLYIQEDRPVGVRLIRLKVTDKDGDRGGNGGPFAFEILSGNSRGDFRITQNGDLLTAVSFAGKGLPSYGLQVRVHDNGRPHLHADAWLSVKVIESSKFEPVVFPLHVMMMIPIEDYKGGSLGGVRASDQDPYDQLYYNIVPDRNKRLSENFKIDLENGTLRSVGMLSDGRYSMNISVSDGKFTTYSPSKIEVSNVEDEMINEGLIIVLGGANPEEFILSYRRSFLRAIKNIMNVNTDDVLVLSVQYTPRRSIKNDSADNFRINSKDTYPRIQRKESDMSVLFSVRKSQNRYFTRKELLNKVTADISLVEATMGLRVLRVEGDMCHNITCSNGRCHDLVMLGDEQVVITTEAMNFVSLKHSHNGVCVCPNGYAGKLCDEIINECAYNPCPKYKICTPDDSDRGFSCSCPEGYVGGLCSKQISECVGYENTPSCFSPRDPISFKGESYAKYNLRSQIESQFEFSTWFKTHQPSGNIMFISGKIDYSILEMHEGRVRYRWELGSGEGSITLTSSPLLNDSNWHHISLKHFRDSAKIMVDNFYSREGTSPGYNEQLNLENSNMFLGAEVRLWQDELENHYGYLGCLDGPRFNDVPLPVNELMSTIHAALVKLHNVRGYCEESLPVSNICGTHPCMNGGKCETTSNSFKCTCKGRFKGKRCELDTNPCASSPCLHNGKCIQDGYSYKCQCPAHVSGNRCQYLYCSPNPCLNHGSCEEGISGPICRCKGFKGIYCNEDINECMASPCKEGGTCINTYGSFDCLCPTNTAGDFCDQTRLLPLMPKIQEVATAVGVIVSLISLGLLTLLLIHCRNRGASQQQNDLSRGNRRTSVPKQNGSDKHKLYGNGPTGNNLNSDGCATQIRSSSSTSNQYGVGVETLDVTQIYDGSGDVHSIETPPKYSREYIMLGKVNTFNLHNLPPPEHLMSGMLSPGAEQNIHQVHSPTVQPPPGFSASDNDYQNGDQWAGATHSNKYHSLSTVQEENYLPPESSNSPVHNIPSSQDSNGPVMRISPNHFHHNSSSPINGNDQSYPDGVADCSRHGASLSTFDRRGENIVSQGQPSPNQPLHNPPDLVPANDPPPHAPSPGPLNGTSNVPQTDNRYLQQHSPHTNLTPSQPSPTRCSSLSRRGRTDRSNSLSSSQTLCPLKLATSDVNNMKSFGTLPRQLQSNGQQKAKVSHPPQEDTWKPQVPSMKKMSTPVPPVLPPTGTYGNSDGPNAPPEMVSRV